MAWKRGSSEQQQRRLQTCRCKQNGEMENESGEVGTKACIVGKLANKVECRMTGFTTTKGKIRDNKHHLLKFSTRIWRDTVYCYANLLNLVTIVIFMHSLPTVFA